MDGVTGKSPNKQKKNGQKHALPTLTDDDDDEEEYDDYYCY